MTTPLSVLYGLGRAVEGSGVICGYSAPHIVNELKLAIAIELQRLGRPVAAEELLEVCPEDTVLEAVEYHLCTLATLGVAKPVPSGPELLFQFVGDPDGRWCRHLGLKGRVRRPN